MDQDTYYRDHWVTIDPDRAAALDAIWDLPEPVMTMILAPLDLQAGHVAVDLGCGPGFVSRAIADRVGAAGHVHGTDLNAEFVERARARAIGAGVADRCSFHLVTDDSIPLDDGCVDRVLAKNVLEYVPDLSAAIGEVRRVLRPGGRLTAIDSDWGFVIGEPLDARELIELFDAAAPAFREPNVGRKLRGAFVTAGLTDVTVEIAAFPDTSGVFGGIFHSMATNGELFDRLSADRAQWFRDRIDGAIADGTYLAVLPQFIVTATEPA